jgi:hypothetical protein
MKVWEIITRLDDMAFRRKAIVDKLHALQGLIIGQALKIIVYPDADDLPHWKRELAARGNDLAGMFLRTIRGPRPMGFDMAWHGLYREPFAGHEDASLRFQLDRLAHEYQRPFSKDPAQVMAELTTFLRSLSQAIGRGQLVYPIVDNLGQPPIGSQEPVSQSAAEQLTNPS